MPVHIKIIVSISTLVVGAALFYCEILHGQISVGLVGAGLAVFMVISMWLFREPGKRS